MTNNLPLAISLKDALTTFREKVAKCWQKNIKNQPELTAIIVGKNHLNFPELQTRLFALLTNSESNSNAFSLQLNKLFIWLLAERQRTQISPDLIARIIFQLQEATREYLNEKNFKSLKEITSLIGWGFIQRYNSEIVEILIKSNEILEQRVLERTIALQESNQKIQNWSKVLELNVADRTRDLLIEKHKLATIIENISEGILVTDFDNKICQVNKIAKSILGIKSKNVLHTHILSLIESPNLLQAITEALDIGPGKTIIKDVEQINAKTKLTQFIRIYSTLAIDDKKEPLGVISVLMDITKEKELETAKARFLNNAAHELRTPLTSILGFLSLVLEPNMGSLDETQRDFLESAFLNGNKLKQLINGLLDLSRLDAGKLKLHLEDVNFTDYIPIIVKDFYDKAIAKNLTFTLTHPKGRDLHLQADPVRLQQIIDHLCFNAIKFTTKGSITVSYAKVANNLEIIIQDTGSGIRKADQALIFERFHQLDHSSAFKSEGTGLGLAVTKALINQHGGTIQVESYLGRGSKFIVSLPLG